MGFYGIYPLVMTNIANWKMAIEILGFPIENGDFPVHHVNVYQVG